MGHSRFGVLTPCIHPAHISRKQNAETCFPLPTAEFAGTDVASEGNENAPYEERATCLFVKRVADERRKAEACFSGVASPSPPPPPPIDGSDRHDQLEVLRDRIDLGEDGPYAQPRPTDRAQWEADFSAARDRANAMIAQLGEKNPVLKSLLAGAVAEINQADFAGRRLMVREEYKTMLTEVLSTHIIMREYGAGGIPGVTVSLPALPEPTLKKPNHPLLPSQNGSTGPARPSARLSPRTRTPPTRASARRSPSAAPLPFPL